MLHFQTLCLPAGLALLPIASLSPCGHATRSMTVCVCLPGRVVHPKILNGRQDLRLIRDQNRRMRLIELPPYPFEFIPKKLGDKAALDDDDREDDNGDDDDDDERSCGDISVSKSDADVSISSDEDEPDDDEEDEDAREWVGLSFWCWFVCLLSLSRRCHERSTGAPCARCGGWG